MSINVTVTSPPVFATIETAEATVQVEVQAPVQIGVQVLGIQGARGPGGSAAGPGLVLVGNELRFSISTLARG